MFAETALSCLKLKKYSFLSRRRSGPPGTKRSRNGSLLEGVETYRMIKEGSELVTKCNRLRLIAEDGKPRYVENEQIIPQKNSRYASNPCGIEVIQKQSLTKILLGNFPRRIFINHRLIIIYITRPGRRCTRGARWQEAASSKAARSRSLVFIGLSQ